MNSRIDFGRFIQQIRKENNYTLKYVAEKLEIDLSLLSKIENGERQLQGHLLKPLANLYNLSYKEIQIKFLYQKIKGEFGEEPFLRETLETYLEGITK